MKIFKAKETFTENIAFMGIMSAINIVLCLIMALLPAISIVLIIALPLVSALVELYCKDRYYPIYLFSTIGLSLVATLWNYGATINYLIPAVISGYIFGFVTKRKLLPIWGIVISGIINAGLVYGGFYLTSAILEIDVINTIRTFLLMSDNKYFDIIFPFFVLTMSLIEMSIAYFVIHFEVKKLGFEYPENNSLVYVDIAIIGLSLLIVPMYFLTLAVAYVFFALAVFLTIFLVGEVITKKDARSLLFFAICLVIGSVFTALMFKIMKDGSFLLSLGLIPFLIAVTNLMYILLNKQEKK